MPSSAKLMPGATKKQQDRANHNCNDAYRPYDSDLCDKSNNEENYS
jgi:hypothetical protein